MKKKNLLTGVISLALVAVIGAGATLAYLTDNTQTMTNTFVMDDLQITLKEDASVPSGQVYQIKETEDDTYGTDPITGAEQGVNYIDVLPGATIEKKPYITVTNTDGAKDFAAAYIYAYVTNLDENAEKAISTTFDEAWDVVDTDELSGVLLRQKVEKNQEENVLVVFQQVKVNSALTGTTPINNVTVEAFAHQADNVDLSVADAAAVAYFK